MPWYAIGSMNARAEQALETSASLLDADRKLDPAQVKEGGWRALHVFDQPDGTSKSWSGFGHSTQFDR
ncbi:MAG: hypothetical protein AAFR46_12975 [Pseudomonadota bacterium]